MKKLFLLLAAGCAAFASQAQQLKEKSIVLLDQTPQYKPAVSAATDAQLASMKHNTNAKKSTAGGSKWYLPYDVADAYLGNVFDNNRYLFYIDWDSTLKQKFTSGYSGVNWIGAAQFVDPINAAGFTDAAIAAGTDIRVNWWNSYSVDSIYFQAAYMVGSAGLTSTKDTLYLSVAPVAFNDATLTPTDNSKVSDYEGVTAHGGNMKIQRLGATDSFNRQLGNAGAIKWKYVLPDTMRKPKNTDGTFPTRGYAIAVPGGLSVPAGSGFAISVAFKPGEPWTAGDSVAQHHYFMLLAAESGDGLRMPYFYYDYTDHSMSYLMHKQQQGGFSSSIGLEMANTNDFAQEFLLLGGHVTCATCSSVTESVGVNGVNTLQAVKAYPNPANSDLTVLFAVNGSADVKVSVVNTVGQVVKTQSVKAEGNGKVNFSTSDLTNGVYFYNVEANGQRATGRVVVAH